MKKKLAALMALVLALFGLVGCGESAADKAAQSADKPDTTGAYPVQVKSCHETLTFEKAPENVLLLSGTDAPILYTLDLLGAVKHQAGTSRFKVDGVALPGVPEDLVAQLDQIPTVESGDTGSGGAKMSTESVLALEPDLVIGYDLGVDREALAAAGIPLYSPDSFCTDTDPNTPLPLASWDLVNNEIDKVASIFGVQDRAEEAKKQVADDLEALKNNDASGATGDAAGLYVMAGTTQFYAYGNTSMVQPILEANGLTNAYADNPIRVFDGSMEDLLSRDPDWIVLISENMTEQETRDVFAAFPGVESLQAVREDQVVYVPFIQTDPPTTMSLVGATTLNKALKEKVQ